MMWLKLGGAAAVLYLLVGIVVAVARIGAHDMPWQLFVFTVLFWPSVVAS